MRIDRFQIENFRCFERYEVRLVPRFTLLIGNNASGKSALLDALSVGAGSLLLGLRGAKQRGIAKDEVRKQAFSIGQSVTQETPGETVVACEGVVDGQSVAWKRTMASPTSRTTRQFAQDLVAVARGMEARLKKNEPVALPVLCYYGTGRLWRQKRARGSETLKRGSRLRGYADCFDPAADPKTLFAWFKTNELAAIQKGTRHVIEAARQAVVACVEQATRVWWDVDWDELMLEVNQSGGTARETPFHFLSDGYRNMVAMVLDIARRAAMLNPHLESSVLQGTPGIVLIDEIDLHLHPTWQRRVIPSLIQAFPAVQFVATTHSPFMIQSLYDLSEVQLWDIAQAGPVPLESKSIEDIAENKQHVETPQQTAKYLEMLHTAKQYYQLLDQAQGADIRERKKIGKELDRLTMPYSDNPAYHAFLEMKREAAGVGRG